MAVPENAGVKVDSSSQNLDNNTASATETKPPCSGDQNPKSDSSIDSSGPGLTPITGDRTNEINAVSKLNPLAKEFVPTVVSGNGVGVSNNLDVPGRSFGHGRRRMNRRTSLAQKEDVIKRTVYVADIDQQFTEEDLAGVFTNCDQIVDCRVCGDPNSALRFAFIEFTSEEGAKAALSLSGTMLGLYPLKVLPSKTAIAPVNPTFLPKSEDEREMCARTIYCTNIDKRITQTELKCFFEILCGQVYRLRLGDNHHQTRIAFVEFAAAEGAIAALHCSGAVLGSLPIRVSPSKTPVRPSIPRTERPLIIAKTRDGEVRQI